MEAEQRTEQGAGPGPEPGPDALPTGPGPEAGTQLPPEPIDKSPEEQTTAEGAEQTGEAKPQGSEAVGDAKPQVEDKKAQKKAGLGIRAEAPNTGRSRPQPVEAPHVEADRGPH